MLKKTLEQTPPLLLVGCGLFFVSAYFAARFPDVPGASVGSFIANGVIFAPAAISLFLWLGPRRASISLIALAAFAYAIETTGLVTGLPYGEFIYGEALGPKAFGLVPYLLPVSYLPLVLGAVGAGWGSGTASRVIKTALILAAIDLVLDPGAVRLGFWEYASGGIYYGVPISNYLGWMISGALAAVVFLLAARPTTPPPRGLLDSAILAVAFWVGIAVFTTLVLPALVGVLVLMFLLIRRTSLSVRKPRVATCKAV